MNMLARRNSRGFGRGDFGPRRACSWGDSQLTCRAPARALAIFRSNFSISADFAFRTGTAYAIQQKIAHVGLSAPHDGAQLKNSHPPLLLFFFIFMAKPGAQGRESLFTCAGRRDDDTSMVLSTAVTSPEVEENDAKMTSRFRPRARNRPARPHLPGRHSSVWGTKCQIIKKRKGGESRRKAQ